MTIPSDLGDKLASLRGRILPLVEHWTRITTTADRLAHRRLNQGNDYHKLSSALTGALEIETAGWRISEVEEVEREERALSGTLAHIGGDRIASAHKQLDTTVEELKRVSARFATIRRCHGEQADTMCSSSIASCMSVSEIFSAGMWPWRPIALRNCGVESRGA